MRSLYGMWKPRIRGEAPVSLQDKLVLLFMLPDALKTAGTPEHPLLMAPVTTMMHTVASDWGHSAHAAYLRHTDIFLLA